MFIFNQSRWSVSIGGGLVVFPDNGIRSKCQFDVNYFSIYFDFTIVFILIILSRRLLMIQNFPNSCNQRDTALRHSRNVV